jgi:Fe2+ or Zn2+ uptake regulation protein
MRHPTVQRDQSTDQARSRLKDHGLKITRQREELLAVLLETDQHPTAEELFEWVRRMQPGLSLATVYNTLESFVRAGLARKIPGEGAARYDADTSEHVHIHTSDGRVIDVPEAIGRRLLSGLDPALIRQIEAHAGVTIDGCRLSLLGTPEA